MIEETNIEENNKKVITYVYARFYKRVLANVVDFLLFLLVFFTLFISVRAIVNNTSYGTFVNSEIERIREESGLYVRIITEDNELTDIITYNNTLDPTPYQKRANAIQAINNFLDYVYDIFCDEESEYYDPSKYETVYNSYLEFFWDEDLVYTNSSGQSATYFLIGVVDEDGRVIENEEYRNLGGVYLDVYEDAYTPFIDEICQGYLITIIPNYYEYTQFSSDMLFFVEIPISYLLGGILVYFVPTLFFKRGRKTLGKALYKIGLVDKNLYNPKFSISVIRFCIFYFAELILSLFTFCIPFMISFTLMVFSKKKQGFCDYMLNLHEVDTTYTPIFYDEKDALVGQIKKPITHVEFKQRDPQ